MNFINPAVQDLHSFPRRTRISHNFHCAKRCGFRITATCRSIGIGASGATVPSTPFRATVIAHDIAQRFALLRLPRRPPRTRGPPSHCQLLLRFPTPNAGRSARLAAGTGQVANGVALLSHRTFVFWRASGREPDMLSQRVVALAPTCAEVSGEPHALRIRPEWYYTFTILW